MKKDFNYQIKIYGVRGSYPFPFKNGSQYGVNTSCLLTRSPENIVIFDAGTGIIQLGTELIPEILEHSKNSANPFSINIIFTHTHIDHIFGLYYFAPLYMPNVHINFIGPATMGVDLEFILRTLCEPQYYPVSMDEFRSSKAFYNISENTVIYFNKDSAEPEIAVLHGEKEPQADFLIKTMKYYFHPKDGSYNYRIKCGNKSVVHATDVEQYVGGDQRLIKFSENADVLIHDAQYTDEQYLKFQGYGHSTWKMACEAAKQAKVKKLLLFHHNPTHSDEDLKKIEDEAKKTCGITEMAYEGWEWKF